MKNINMLLLALVALASPLPGASPEWSLVWSDEFDYQGPPDPEKWGYETGFVRNNEAQFYTEARKENARVENGVLIIEARKERFANPNYDANAAKESIAPGAAQGDYSRIANATREFAEYTAASVISRHKAEWQYGRFEIRAKIPTGRGIWPAIWMLGTNRGPVKWPACGEIDIMEYVGWHPNQIHGNVHQPSRYAEGMTEEKAAAANMKGIVEVTDPHADFHVYGIEWDADRISFFFDDRTYLTYENPRSGVEAWPFDQPFYLLLNVAVGGTWGGKKGIDDSIFPQRMEVDYVRVYKREKNNPDARF